MSGMKSRKKKTPPPEATCCVCLSRRKCSIERPMQDGKIRRYDNFFYSPKHRGSLCAKCNRRFEENGDIDDVPEILRRPRE